MKLSKGQKISIYLGVILLALPYSIYFYSRAMGYLPSESDWWSQGINHGPWRWKWQMLFVLPSLYLFVFGSVFLFIIGAIKAFTQRSAQYILNYGGLSILYFSIFYLQASTIFWTID